MLYTHHQTLLLLLLEERWVCLMLATLQPVHAHTLHASLVLQRLTTLLAYAMYQDPLWSSHVQLLDMALNRYGMSQDSSLQEEERQVFYSEYHLFSQD